MCADGTLSPSCTCSGCGIYTPPPPDPTPVDPPPVVVTPPNPIKEITYNGFIIWLDTNKRGAIKFQYSLSKDNGNLPREKNFYLDPNIPLSYQQSSAEPYDHQFDRGHLVPINHLDNDADAMRDSNSMINILPQAVNMNRGAWLKTEEISECYRDIINLQIIGGVIWGDNTANDYFVDSHGITTPDAFWKVIIKNSGQAIAWIIPNNSTAIKSKLDKYLVSIKTIESKTGEFIPIDNAKKSSKPSKSWKIPRGCKLD